MNVVGGPGLLVVLVLLGTLVACSTLSWIGLATGIDGVYDDTRADGRSGPPALDAFLLPSVFVFAPVLILSRSPVTPSRGACATRTPAPRGPPGG
jgi:hypothetical protein